MHSLIDNTNLLCHAQLHQAELPSSYMYTGPVTSTSPAAVMATLRSIQKGPPLLPTQNPSIPFSVSPPYFSPLSCAPKLKISQRGVNEHCQAHHANVVYAQQKQSGSLNRSICNRVGRLLMATLSFMDSFEGPSPAALIILCLHQRQFYLPALGGSHVVMSSALHNM